MLWKESGGEQWRALRQPRLLLLAELHLLRLQDIRLHYSPIFFLKSEASKTESRGGRTICRFKTTRYMPPLLPFSPTTTPSPSSRKRGAACPHKSLAPSPTKEGCVAPFPSPLWQPTWLQLVPVKEGARCSRRGIGIAHGRGPIGEMEEGVGAHVVCVL